MISQSRWDWIVDEVVFGAKLRIYLEEGELEIIESVLKNNTPFRVVPDCCLGKTPNKETIEAMIAKESQEISSTDVLLETKNFSVLGDKE